MYKYETILRSLEESVRASFARQVLDRKREDYGAFMSATGFPSAATDGNASGLAGACYAFLAEESSLQDDKDLFDRIILSAAFQRRWQRPSGLIDLPSTNWECPADTGFTVQLLAPIVEMARKKASLGNNDRANRIADAVGEYVRTAAQGMIDGGFHTPNHRWVICSALAQAMTLYPDLPAMDYIKKLLAETIDINDDGEYTERSTGVYDAVCNRSLRFMADHLKKPELFEPVRRNLNMLLHMFHADGSVDTTVSIRQDRGQWIVPIGLADSYFDMAQRDGNGAWASMADQLVAGSANRQPIWLIEPFVSHPEYRGESLKRLPVPDNFARFMPVSKIWRVRRGPLSATAAADNTAPFALRYGTAVLNAVKIAASYFAQEQFSADVFEKHGDGIRMIKRGAARPPPYYITPFGKPVPFGEFYSTHKNRQRQTLPAFDVQLDIREVAQGFDLHVTTTGGMDDVTFQIECCFEGPGEWETDGSVIQTVNGQTAILKSGYGVFSREHYGIRVGPGLAAHRMWQMRGAELDRNVFRVLITVQAPVDRILEIRYGPCWAAAGNLP